MGGGAADGRGSRPRPATSRRRSIRASGPPAGWPRRPAGLDARLAAPAAAGRAALRVGHRRGDPVGGRGVPRKSESAHVFLSAAAPREPSRERRPLWSWWVEVGGGARSSRRCCALAVRQHASGGGHGPSDEAPRLARPAVARVGRVGRGKRRTAAARDAGGGAGVLPGLRLNGNAPCGSEPTRPPARRHHVDPQRHRLLSCQPNRASRLQDSRSGSFDPPRGGLDGVR